MLPMGSPVHVPHPQLPLVPMQVTPFHSSRPPAITVKSYLEDRYALVAFLSLDAHVVLELSPAAGHALCGANVCASCVRMCP